MSSVLRRNPRKKVVIHTDGACDGNPGPGGWAAILQYGPHMREVSGGVGHTTNNRMELQAAIEALRALKEPCDIEFFTDSQYLRQGITEWVRSWKRNGWRTMDRKPVKNAEQWRELDALTAPHEISWHWLRGHAGHKLNERCDKLAKKEIRKLSRVQSADRNPKGNGDLLCIRAHPRDPRSKSLHLFFHEISGLAAVQDRSKAPRMTDLGG